MRAFHLIMAAVVVLAFAAPAIAAGRSAELNIFLTPKADATGTAVAAFNEYFLLVEKLHDYFLKPITLT